VRRKKKNQTNQRIERGEKKERMRKRTWDGLTLADSIADFIASIDVFTT
jgi:hypothetical protein